MAWILNQNNELEEQQEDTQQPDLSGSGSAGGGSGAMGGSPNIQAASAAPTSSGNFTSINRYIENNQDQSENLGNKVAQGIEQTTNTANTSIDSAQQDFNQKLSATNPALSKDDITGLSSDPRKLSEFVRDQANVDKFKNTAGGQYTGPNAFSDIGGYADLIKNVSNASKAPELLKTTGGTQELIKNVYNDPSRAKTGMLGLDNALLRQTPTAYKPVQEKADAAGTLNKRLEDIQNNANTAIVNQKQSVQDRSKQIQDQFLGETGTYNNLKSNVENKYQTKLKDTASAADEAKNYLNMDWLRQNKVIQDQVGDPFSRGYNFESGVGISPGIDPSKINISDSALRQLGVTKDQYIDLLNNYSNEKFKTGSFAAARGKPKLDAVIKENEAKGKWGKYTPIKDFTEYFTGVSPESQINKSQTASQEDYDQLQALEALFADQVDESIIGDPSKAGTYNDDVVDFRYDDLLSALSQNINLVPTMARQRR